MPRAGAGLTPPVSAAGSGLYRKFTPPATAADMFNADFIARQLAAGVTLEELDRLAREQNEALISGPSPDLVLATPSRPSRKDRRRKR